MKYEININKVINCSLKFLEKSISGDFLIGVYIVLQINIPLQKIRKQ